MITKKICLLSMIILGCVAGFSLSYAVATPTGKYITIKNNTGSTEKFYFELSNMPKYKISKALKNKFKALKYPCAFPENPYIGQGNMQTCSFTMPNGKSQDMPLQYFSLQGMALVVSAGNNHYPQGNCNTTMGEIFINSSADTYDVSLVNGQNFNMKIIPSHTGAKTINLNTDTLSAIKAIHGVFPPGCDTCTAGAGAPNTNGNPAINTQNCPAYPSGNMSAASCSSTPTCQRTEQPQSDYYTVIFSKKGN